MTAMKRTVEFIITMAMLIALWSLYSVFLGCGIYGAWKMLNTKPEAFAAVAIIFGIIVILAAVERQNNLLVALLEKPRNRPG